MKAGKAWFSLAMQAQFLFHRENGLDTGIRKRTSTKIKIFLFLVLSMLMLAFVLQQVKTKYQLRHNTSTRLFTTHAGYVSPMKTLDSDYLAPWQFFKLKLVKGSGDFTCACVCVEFCFSLECLRLCLMCLHQ